MRDDLWVNSAEKKIQRELGEEINSLLLDEKITEIMLNEDGAIWTDRLDTGMTKTGIYMPRDKAMLVIGSIAAYKHTTVTEKKPLLKATLPGGQRFQAMVEPVTAVPVFSIRCGRAIALRLEDYVPERMSQEVALLLQEAIVGRKNIIVSGGTSSGKTTLASAMLAEMGRLCPDDRIAIMEDTRELQLVNKNVIFELTTDEISTNDLLAANLRMRPDRIILGETRGSEALDLLKAWNTGHPGGICTLHANSALSALSRFESLILEAKNMSLTIPFVRSLIADAVNLVVHIQKLRGYGPIVTDVLAIHGLNIDGTYKTEILAQNKKKERWT